MISLKPDFRYVIERANSKREGVIRRKSISEAKEIVERMLPPHLYRQAWIRNREHNHYRKASDFCKVYLTRIQ